MSNAAAADFLSDGYYSSSSSSCSLEPDSDDDMPTSAFTFSKTSRRGGVLDFKGRDLNDAELDRHLRKFNADYPVQIVKVLNLSGNKLTRLPEDFLRSRGGGIHTLNCAYNQLEVLPKDRDWMESVLRKLRLFFLWPNKLLKTEWPALCYHLETKVCDGREQKKLFEKAVRGELNVQAPAPDLRSSEWELQPRDPQKKLFDVFLSHSGRGAGDKHDTLILAIALEALGFKVFYDLQSINDKVEKDIINGLSQSAIVLAWCTPDYFESEWAMQETWSMFCQRGSATVLPYLIGVGIDFEKHDHLPMVQRVGLNVDVFDSNEATTFWKEGHDQIMPLGYALAYKRVQKNLLELERGKGLSPEQLVAVSKQVQESLKLVDAESTGNICSREVAEDVLDLIAGRVRRWEESLGDDLANVTPQEIERVGRAASELTRPSELT